MAAILEIGKCLFPGVCFTTYAYPCNKVLTNDKTLSRSTVIGIGHFSSEISRSLPDRGCLSQLDLQGRGLSIWGSKHHKGSNYPPGPTNAPSLPCEMTTKRVKANSLISH